MQHRSIRVCVLVQAVSGGDGEANPFNPGFGVRPPMMAGRQGVINEILVRLSRGPGRHEFITVVAGARGVGKTVLLADIGEHVRQENRWVTMTWNAGLPLAEALDEQGPGVERQLRGFLRRSSLAGSEVTVKATPGGIGAEAKVERRRRPPAAGPYGQLERLARGAAERRRTVVLLVDELQAGSAHDLKALTAALQQLSNVERLPLAMVAVGLPSTRNVLRSADVSPGFTERLEPLTLGNLDTDATWEALEVPFVDAGRTVNAKAIEHLVTASGGYPYAIQLVGYHCWEAARGSATITAQHARRAAVKVAAVMEDRIFEGRWDSISPADRRYLVLAAGLDGEGRDVPTAAIAKATERSAESLSGNRDRLINVHHVLEPAGRGIVRFSVPGFAAWVRSRAHRHG